MEMRWPFSTINEGSVQTGSASTVRCWACTNCSTSNWHGHRCSTSTRLRRVVSSHGPQGGEIDERGVACGQKTRRGPSPPEQSRFLFLINVSVSAAFNEPVVEPFTISAQ